MYFIFSFLARSLPYLVDEVESSVRGFGCGGAATAIGGGIALAEDETAVNHWARIKMGQLGLRETRIHGACSNVVHQNRVYVLDPVQRLRVGCFV